MKLVSKKRIGGRVTKKYDTAKTPYRRGPDAPQVRVESKIQLQQLYLSLNPAALLRKIRALQKELWRVAKS